MTSASRAAAGARKDTRPQRQPGDRLAYICRKCGYETRTVHHAAGPVPVFIGCRSPEPCDGYASSTWYAPFEGEPTHEWYKPEARDLRELDTMSADYVLRGGLLLRPIPQETTDV